MHLEFQIWLLPSVMTDLIPDTTVYRLPSLLTTMKRVIYRKLKAVKGFQNIKDCENCHIRWLACSKPPVDIDLKVVF